jgi:hypothetical protein
MLSSDKLVVNRAYFDMGYLAEVKLDHVHCLCGVV